MWHGACGVAWGKTSTRCGTRTRNPQIRSLILYAIHCANRASKTDYQHTNTQQPASTTTYTTARTTQRLVHASRNTNHTIKQENDSLRRRCRCTCKKCKRKCTTLVTDTHTSTRTWSDHDRRDERRQAHPRPATPELASRRQTLTSCYHHRHCSGTSTSQVHYKQPPATRNSQLAINYEATSTTAK